MKLKGSRVVIRREKAPDRIGSIFLPEVAQRPTLTGEVLLVGDGCHTLTVGERVVFGARSWSPFLKMGEDACLVWERDVLGVLE